MKTCIDCNSLKENNNFPYDKNRNRYLSVCKKCVSLRTQRYRLKNPDKWKKYDKNRIENLTKIINKWKEEGCKKCGDKRIYVLDAHHIDPKIKKHSIGDKDMGSNKLKEELKKCIPICSKDRKSTRLNSSHT